MRAIFTIVLLLAAADDPDRGLSRVIEYTNEYTAAPDFSKLEKFPKAKLTIHAKVLAFDRPSEPREAYPIKVELLGLEKLEAATPKQTMTFDARSITATTLRELAAGQTIEIGGQAYLAEDGIPATLQSNGFSIVGGRSDPRAALFTFKEKDGGRDICVALKNAKLKIAK